jgi:hypothetical protein
MVQDGQGWSRLVKAGQRWLNLSTTHDQEVEVIPLIYST